jgi:hypothetical protein
MQTKLTLRIDDELIKKAKRVAHKRGKSLSRIVSDYFNHISVEDNTDDLKLPPNAESLYGSLTNSKIDESDYKKYLEKKYL